MFAALAFVACEKENHNDIYGNTQYHVKCYPETLFFNKETGGIATIETEVDAFVSGLGRMKGKERVGESLYEYDIPAPEYIIKLEQIQKHKEFVTDGCKVVPDGFCKFTITVEPNCGYDHYDISFSRVIESKKYGKIAQRGGSVLQVVLQ